MQFGCGLCAPVEWENYDASPTLRIQKLPVIGTLLSNKLNVQFPENVFYGDITNGLPVEENSCDGVYSSHTLEHLSFDDFRKALRNVYKILKPDGVFRCVIPDLEAAARQYLTDVEINKPEASINFMQNTLLGKEKRERGFKSLAKALFGNSHHLWMWDRISLKNELINAGFKKVRECHFNDSEDEMFKFVEDPDRFVKAVAMECKK